MKFTLKDFFDVKKVLAYARARIPRNYVGPLLFPVRTIEELKVEYLLGANNLPVAATIQPFGAEASIASRDGFDKYSQEALAIKRKIALKGEELIRLKQVLAGLSAQERSVVEQLYNDLDAMIDAVYTRIEMMRIEALANGTIAINENGVIGTFDYGVPAGHKETLTAGALWSASATADPIGDIQRWTTTILNDTGELPTRALTSSAQVANILKCVNVRKQLYGDNAGSRVITLPEVNNLLQAMNLPQIATYDLQYREQAVDGSYTTKRFLAANKFILMPGSALGESLMGPTEEALIDEYVDAREVSGIYACVYREREPVGVWTKASATTGITFPTADRVFQAVVGA